MKNYVQNSYRGIRDSELTMKNVHAVPQLQCVQSEEGREMKEATKTEGSGGRLA